MDVPSSDQPLVGAQDRSRYIEIPWFRYLQANTPAAAASANVVLHGNLSGPPTWSAVDLAADVTGALPIPNGGTGDDGTRVTGLTGNGDIVLGNFPFISGPLMADPRIQGSFAWNVFSTLTGPQMRGLDRNTVSVTAVATTICDQDEAMIFVVHDLTSGGITLGKMDSVGGVVVISAGVAGIAFTRSAGLGLQAAVTAGVNPRSLSTFAISVGSP